MLDLMTAGKERAVVGSAFESHVSRNWYRSRWLGKLFAALGISRRHGLVFGAGSGLAGNDSALTFGNLCRFRMD